MCVQARHFTSVQHGEVIDYIIHNISVKTVMNLLAYRDTSTREKPLLTNNNRAASFKFEVHMKLLRGGVHLSQNAFLSGMGNQLDYCHHNLAQTHCQFLLFSDVGGKRLLPTGLLPVQP